MYLDDRLDRVERYGFPRWAFPIRYNGHTLTLLQNDAHDTSEGRVLLHFTLYCEKCEREHSVRCRLLSDEENPEYRAAVAKVGAFGPFVEESCSR